VIRAYLELVPESEKIGELQAALEKAAAEKAASEAAAERAAAEKAAAEKAAARAAAKKAAAEKAAAEKAAAEKAAAEKAAAEKAATEGTAAGKLQFREAQATGRDVEITNGIGMKFRLIPPGTFLMGSPGHEESRRSDEHQHEVTLTRPFYMGVYPVTQDEWTRVMNSAKNSRSFLSRLLLSADSNRESVSQNPSHFKSVSGEDTSRFPVENVSWNAAQEFLGKLNASHGMSGVCYRLPTEAEWEYACRAGTTTPFSFGGVLQGDKANCRGNRPYGTISTGPYLKRTSAVGSYGANGFGLYDTHGNVWEWCQDRYGWGYYSSSPSEDPAGPSSGSSRVLRGGSWRNVAYYCRSAHRLSDVPEGSYSSRGFRVLCELS
jgi:formylglycine-generating enzyme required for sulfatase activity